MNRRAINLFKILAREGDYVNSELLCKEIGIKPRTLREDIKNNRNLIESKSGATIENKPNFGYRLNIINETMFYDFMQEMMQIEANEQFIMPVQQDDRVHYLIRIFLGTREFLKIDDLAEMLYVSKSTLSSDIKLVKEQLKFQNVQLQSKVGSGLRIQGNESDIRSTMSLYFFHSRDFDQSQLKHSNLDIFDVESKNKISEMLYKKIIEYNFKLTDFGFQNLVIHILISVYRIREKTYVEDKSLKFDDLLEKQEWIIASAIASEIESEFNLYLPQGEIAYITIHLLGKKVLDKGDDAIVDTRTLNLVNDIFNEIQDKFKYTFHNDIELFTMLSLHIQPMLSRMKYGIKLHNPLLDQIKEENPFAFEMSVTASSVICTRINEKIDESELGYLTLHFALALQRNVDKIKNKVLIVCASGGGTSQILLYKVKTELNDLINETKVINAFELDHIDQKQYDLILSTIPITQVTKIPVIQVQYTLEESDVSKVKKYLTRDLDEISTIKSWFNEDLIISNTSINTQSELIEMMCDNLNKVIELPTTFKNLVIEREVLTSTYIGNGIAIPHPAHLIADKTAISVCHLDKPIKWGVNEVSLVFLIAIEKNETNLLVLFNKLMGNLLNNFDLIKSIREDRSYENLMNQLDLLFEIESLSEEQNIFA